MPSLDLPDLKAYTYAKQTTPPPVAAPAGVPIGSSATTPPAQTPCQPSFQLAVEQGATLSTQITIQIQDATGVLHPVDVTGYKFQFTAKTDPNLPDSDPSTVMLNWQETNTPQQGITWLVLPASVTQAMQVMVYYYQIRMVSPSNVVTPIASGTLTIVQPISPRFA